MAAHPAQPQDLTGDGEQPLIAIPAEEHGRTVVRYFTDEAAADAATPDAVTEAALAAIGAWGDLDWDDLERELERIDRETPPTPVIDQAY